MQYESACDRLCDDIAHVLFQFRPPTQGAAYAAALATQAIAAAMHHASGAPGDRMWVKAASSLASFLAFCYEPRIETTPELLELRAFLKENADLLSPQPRAWERRGTSPASKSPIFARG